MKITIKKIGEVIVSEFEIKIHKFSVENCTMVELEEYATKRAIRVLQANLKRIKSDKRKSK